MEVVAVPTPEKYNQVINGVEVPVRIWRARTDRGTRIEMFVLSIIPADTEDVQQLRDELPPYFTPSRDTFQIGKGVHTPEVRLKQLQDQLNVLLTESRLIAPEAQGEWMRARIREELTNGD